VNLLNPEPAKILIVDDNHFSRMTTVDILSFEGYQVIESDSDAEIVTLAAEMQPDCIILEVKPPQMEGFLLCRLLKENSLTQKIPIIFVTVASDRRSHLQSIEVGGDDFLIKPLERFTLLARVKSLINQKRLNEGLDQTAQVLLSIAQALESRYSRQENSSTNLANLAKIFGTYLELSSQEIDDLIFASYLHDIGTVGIPDSIFLKKEALTAQERELINQHVLIGEKICQPLQSRRGVLPIIRHHHEKWNGSGYPDGLKGDQIPFLAQVFQILDIYEALISDRPHKAALTPSQAVSILQQETIKGWRNPKLMPQFQDFIKKLCLNSRSSLEDKGVFSQKINF
jgi:putative two-component system response regulator